MPILEISMVPTDQVEKLTVLQHDLKELVSSYEGLQAINYDDVVINFVSSGNASADSSFLYVKAWMYDGEGRSLIASKLIDDIGRVILKHMKQYLQNLQRVLLFPVCLLQELECSVVTE